MENNGYTVIKSDKSLTHIFGDKATIYTSNNEVIEYLEYLVSISEAKLIINDGENRLYETRSDNVDITPFDSEMKDYMRNGSEKPQETK